jgi:hypothetical protein
VERTIGCPLLRAWAETCRFGELSQQPMCPQVWHILRCTHLPPIAMQSSQPGDRLRQLGQLDAVQVFADVCHLVSTSISAAAS